MGGSSSNLNGLSNAITYHSEITFDGQNRIKILKYVTATPEKITILITIPPGKEKKIELFPPEGETFTDAKFAKIPYLEGKATYGGDKYTYRIMEWDKYLKELFPPSQAPSQASSEAIPPLRFTPMSAIVATRFGKSSKRRRQPRQPTRQRKERPPPTYIIVLKKL